MAPRRVATLSKPARRDMRSARSASRVLTEELDVEEVARACVCGGACPSDPSLIAVVLKAELGVPLQPCVSGLLLNRGERLTGQSQRVFRLHLGEEGD